VTATTPDVRPALFAGVACYVIWGLSPLVYQPMGAAGADAWEIMGHRAVWGVIWAAGLVLLAGQSAGVRRALTDWRTLRWLVLSTLLIAINWALFIWAVNNGHTLETSLGYYLNPLLNTGHRGLGCSASASAAPACSPSPWPPSASPCRRQRSAVCR